MSMNLSFLKMTLLIFIVSIVASCSSHALQKPAQWQTSSKIKFSLDDIHSNGLRGSAHGLVAVSYEFCLPADDQVYKEVQRIDPSVKFHPGSRGRIHCAQDQALSIGDTNQANWREVLNELSSLTYIAEIQESFFE